MPSTLQALLARLAWRPAPPPNVCPAGEEEEAVDGVGLEPSRGAEDPFIVQSTTKVQHCVQVFILMQLVNYYQHSHTNHRQLQLLHNGGVRGRCVPSVYLRIHCIVADIVVVKSHCSPTNGVVVERWVTAVCISCLCVLWAAKGEQTHASKQPGDQGCNTSSHTHLFVALLRSLYEMVLAMQ